MRQLLLKIYYWAKYYWPSERAWREATGYFTAGLGLILGLAIHSYHAEDSARQASHILNNAGPLGAVLANFV